jgi:hypothetical protein
LCIMSNTEFIGLLYQVSIYLKPAQSLGKLIKE